MERIYKHTHSKKNGFLHRKMLIGKVKEEGGGRKSNGE